MLQILISLIQLTNSLVDITIPCSCDQLSDFECSYFNRCEFINGVCSSKYCSDLDSYSCFTNPNCTLYNNQCQHFTFCSNYEAQSLSECIKINPSCDFNVTGQRCTWQNDINYNCTYLPKDQCQKGRDGKCILLQNKCELWTKCEDASQELCSQGGLHCVWSDSKNLCVSVNDCEEIVDDFCLFALPEINSNLGYICKYKDGKCTEFEPSLQTQDTCILQSFGYYQWKDNQCQQCKKNAQIISLLWIITILIN